MRSLLDKDFKYTPSAGTDADYLRAKFKLIREQQEKEAKEKAEKVCGEIKPKIRGKA